MRILNLLREQVRVLIFGDDHRDFFLFEVRQIRVVELVLLMLLQMSLQKINLRKRSELLLTLVDFLLEFVCAEFQSGLKMRFRERAFS